MSAEQNKEIMRGMIEELWNKKDMAAAEKYFSADSYAPDIPQLPPGPMGVKIVAGMFLEAFPDLQMTIEDIVAEGDTVVARFTETGTHNGPFMGVPATGKSVKFAETGWLKIKDGQIQQSWYNVDIFSIMQQIGAIPGPPGS